MVQRLTSTEEAAETITFGLVQKTTHLEFPFPEG